MRLTLLLGIIATTCHAGNCTDGRPGTTVFFLNGILGDPMETERAKDALKTRVVQALQGTPKQNACLVFLNAYNLSGGFFADVLESYRQQVGDAAASQTFLDVVDGSTPPSLLQISYTSATLRSLVIPSTAQPVVDAHVVFFEQVLSESNQVIVVAHSQGNFFANEEYARLLQRGTLVPERFKIISVATPDSFTAGNGPYSTLCSDFIVKFILGARPANICSSALQSAVLWQHGFEKWYLGNVLSRTQIINQIVDAIQVPVAGTGIVTVNATLDGSPWSDAGNSSFGSYIQSTVSCGSPGATKAQISNNLVQRQREI